MRPVHSRSPYRAVRHSSALFNMPESGNQYVSLDDGTQRGWLGGVVSHPKERTLFISLVVVSVVAVALLGATIYYAKHTCPVAPVTPTTPTTTHTPPTTHRTTTSTTTHRPTTSSTTTHKPTTSSTTHSPTTTSTTDHDQSTTTRRWTSSTTERSESTTTQEPPTTTTKKHKSKTTTLTSEPPTGKPEYSNSDEWNTDSPVKHIVFPEERKKKAKHEQDFY